MTARLLSVAEATGLRAHWDSLPGNVFSSPSVVLATLGLAGADRLQVLVVDGVAGLDLVLPVHVVDRFRKVPVPALSTWTHDYCYLGDPLVRPGREEQAWVEVLSFLRAESQVPWLHLPRLLAVGPVIEGLRAALRTCGLTAVEIGTHERAAVRRRPQATYFDETVRGVHRKGYRRQRRVLGREVGEVVTEVGTDPTAFLDLEAAGWKSGTSMRADPGAEAMLHGLVDSGVASVLSLRAGDRVVASQVQLTRDPGASGVSSCFKTAYDESLGQHSPGTLLQLDVVQHFHDSPGIDLLDSCAAPGHPLVDRLFPDRLPVTTLLIGLTARGRATAALTPVLAQGWSRLARRPMEVP